MSKITKEDICTDVFGFNLGNKPVLRIPTGITKIGKETFAGNETIEVLILSDTVEVIGKSAFENCRNLAAVISLQGSRLRKIDKRAFANSGLLIANFPYQVKISDTAFDGCQNLDGLFNFHSDKDSEDSENSEEVEDDDISSPSGCCRYNIKASGSYPNIEELKVTNCEEYKELLASAFELVLGAIEHKIKDIKVNSTDSADKYPFPFKSEMDEIKIMGFTNIINILREEFADLGI